LDLLFVAGLLTDLSPADTFPLYSNNSGLHMHCLRFIKNHSSGYCCRFTRHSLLKRLCYLTKSSTKIYFLIE